MFFTQLTLPANKNYEIFEGFILTLVTLLVFSQYWLVGYLASSLGVNANSFFEAKYDSQIKFSTAFSIFYFLCYFLAPMLFWVGIFSRNRSFFYYRYSLNAIFILLLAYALFCIFPTNLYSIEYLNGIENLTTDNLNDQVAEISLFTISPWNMFPSTHVAIAWIATRYLFEEINNLIFRVLFLTWFAGMCIATVTLKVHFIADGIAGVLIAEATYQLFKSKIFTQLLSNTLNKKNICKRIIVLLALISFASVGLVLEAPMMKNVPLANKEFVRANLAKMQRSENPHPASPDGQPKK